MCLCIQEHEIKKQKVKGMKHDLLEGLLCICVGALARDWDYVINRKVSSGTLR